MPVKSAMTDAEYWAISIALFWVVPAIVGAWIGRSKRRYGAGLLLGVLLSWLGVLIVSLIRGSDQTTDAPSRSNTGVLLGVLGIAGAVAWGVYSYNSLPTGDRIDIEATVFQITGKSAACSSAGFMLLQGRNAEVFNCGREFASPPEPLGCFAVVDDIVYDVSPQVGRKSC